MATGFVYYRDFEDERSVNFLTDGRADFDGGHLQPFVSGSFQDTRERLNAEIDIRAPRVQTAVAAGTRIVLGPRTGLLLTARRADLRFDEGVRFEDVLLSRTLNSTTTSVEAAFERALTPLTTFSLAAGVQRDQFEESPGRDSDTFRILPMLQFDPTALIRGSLAVGYRSFDPASPSIPDYSGLIAQAALAYTLRDRTRFDVTAARDVQYSFEESEPYYLTSSVGLTVTHRLVGRLDIRATGALQKLSYRSVTVVDDRTDDVGIVGGGIGYWLSDNIRLGFNAEYSERRSDRPDRRYDRTRLFASLTYGL
jgi:hypothetical protein